MDVPQQLGKMLKREYNYYNYIIKYERRCSNEEGI